MKTRGKVLGQHFLVNKPKLQKIVEALDLKPGDTVIEIGPGHGELTLLLARNFQFLISNFQIIAIEKDLKLANDLKSKIQNLGIKNVKIIKGDALKILPDLCSKFHDLSFKIVGNIPYYITGHLLRIIGELENKPSLIVLTVQKEVAQRIIAQPPRMNLLAASVQFWAEPEIIDYISKKDFRPQPKVDSAIIKFNIRKFDLLNIDNNFGRSNFQEIKNNYYKLIKILFKQPRKTILNNLLNIKRFDLPKIDVNIRRSNLQKLLKNVGINPSDRPQNLTIEQIKKLLKNI